MAKKASAKAEVGGKKSSKRSRSSASTVPARVSSGGSRSQSRSEENQTDLVDALIKLLQSPLVIDLLAVGATAALAAITETRSSRAQGVVGNSKKTLKAAGKAAAAAVGRRIATEFDEIREASRRAGGDRKARGGAGV
jgi:hypothetical protein